MISNPLLKTSTYCVNLFSLGFFSISFNSQVHRLFCFCGFKDFLIGSYSFFFNFFFSLSFGLFSFNLFFNLFGFNRSNCFNHHCKLIVSQRIKNFHLSFSVFLSKTSANQSSHSLLNLLLLLNCLKSRL